MFLLFLIYFFFSFFLLFIFLLILFFINNKNENLKFLPLLLMEFFKFYSEFLFDEKFIDVNQNNNLNFNTPRDFGFEIFIQHPFSSYNTAKSTKKIKYIQECFKEAYQILEKKLNYFNNNNYNEMFPFLNDLIF